MKKWNLFLSLSLTVFLSLIGSSCSKKEKLDNDTFFINLQTEPPTLDYSKATDVISSLVIDNIMDGLTDYDLTASTLPAVPKIAKSWEISHDKKTYTFRLRDDVLWSDGKKVTAHDFVYSWQRLLDPATGSMYAYFIFDVVNAQEFNAGKIKDFNQVGIKALDDFSFQVTLKAPAAYFPYIPTHSSTFPIRKDIVELYGDQWTEPGKMVTNGPFKLTEWKHDYRMVLESNDSYWGAKPQVKRVIGYMINEASSALKLYQTGKLDLLWELPPIELPQLKNHPDFKGGHFLAAYYVGLNVKKAPCDNPTVRKALNAAINREEVCRILGGGETPLTSWIPIGVTGHDPNLGTKFSPETAQRLLESAGYTLKDIDGQKKWVDRAGKSFPKLTAVYNTNERHQTVLENIQAQLKKNLHVEMELQNQEWKVYIDTLDTGKKNPNTANYQLFRMGWVGDYPDPDNFMNLFTSYSDNNHTGFANKEYDKIIEQAKSELDLQKRVALYTRAQKLLTEDEVAIIPLFTYAHQIMMKPSVKGYPMNGMDKRYLDTVRLER